MFGKTKETSDIDEQTDHDNADSDFFGDETAVAEALRVDHLHNRVTSVEQQISSQFTSLAAYAQIAQEQVELVRSEAQHTSERSEERVIGLIERERADRLASEPGGGIDVTVRLDALDAQVAEIRDGLDQCLLNQEALADAITELFNSIDHTVPAAPAAQAAPAADTALVTEAVAPTQPAAPAEATTAAPAPLTATPSTPMLHETLPPPQGTELTLAELDHELEELGVDVRADAEQVHDIEDYLDIEDHVDEHAEIEDHARTEAPAALYGGPIAGLSLA